MALVPPKICGCTCGQECPVRMPDDLTHPVIMKQEGVKYCEDCLSCIAMEVSP